MTIYKYLKSKYGKRIVKQIFDSNSELNKSKAIGIIGGIENGKHLQGNTWTDWKHPAGRSRKCGKRAWPGSKDTGKA